MIVNSGHNSGLQSSPTQIFKASHLSTSHLLSVKIRGEPRLYYDKMSDNIIIIYSIEQIDVVSPSGVITSTLADDEQGRTGVKYRVAYWTPSELQSGANTFCFMALDTSGKYR